MPSEKKRLKQHEDIAPDRVVHSAHVSRISRCFVGKSNPSTRPGDLIYRCRRTSVDRVSGFLAAITSPLSVAAPTSSRSRSRNAGNCRRLRAPTLSDIYPTISNFGSRFISVVRRRLIYAYDIGRGYAVYVQNDRRDMPPARCRDPTHNLLFLGAIRKAYQR